MQGFSSNTNILKKNDRFQCFECVFLNKMNIICKKYSILIIRWVAFFVQLYYRGLVLLILTDMR